MKKTKKQSIEEKFHDKYAFSVNVNDISVEENFSFAAQENRRALNVFGNLKDKKILDLGCGFGETATFWAKKGAKVEAIDISNQSINIAKKLATKYRVSKKCNFRQMAAEDLKFNSDYFDFVFGNGVLHHVNLISTMKEVKRVMKKDGKAVFIEPLAYNPVINIYRSIAGEVRTPTEMPLTFGSINRMKNYFSKVEHKEFELFTLLIFIWFFLVSRVSPNKQRYWRKILQVEGTLKKVLKILIMIDRVVLDIFPPIRFLCWNTVIVISK